MSIALKNMKEYDSKITAIKHILALLEWDQQTKMPSKGIEERSKQISLISTQYHEMLTSPEFAHSVNALKKKNVYDSLKPIEKDMVRRYDRLISRKQKIPLSHVREYSKLVSESLYHWETAKKKNNYAIFKPYLKKIIDMKRKEANYIDPKKNPYEVLLDEYEEGMQVERLDYEFSKLKGGLTVLSEKIRKAKNHNETKKYSDKIKNLKISRVELERISNNIASIILKDKDRYRIDSSMHPFTATMGLDDVRITTKYDNVHFCIGSTIHEAGHALYELSFDPALRGTILADAPSLGMHESQSRYWENHVGLSMGFWKANYNLIKKHLGNMTLKQYYNGINHTEPSLIRVESDEVTYCLHIIIRYELERGLMEGTISVNDLPELWNTKYKTLLGLKPKRNDEGVLQ
ncbi:MAG: carboxypeptidase M32, partial [Candidatus Woesearchaeota archaeon]